MKKILGLLLAFILMLPISGFANEAKNELSFEFFVEPVIGIDQTAFEIVLKNSGTLPIRFEFPSSQKYELKVIDTKGKEVYVYSKDQSFLQGIQAISLNPNEEKRWKEVWNNQIAGNRVQEGQYKVKGILKSTKRNHINTLPVEFESTLFIPKSDANFQNIKVTGRKGRYQVKGEARPRLGEFYYTVEDGHNEQIKETKVQTGSRFPQWNPFQLDISIPEKNLPKNGTLILNLYERDTNGTTIQSTPVVLEQFHEEG